MAPVIIPSKPLSVAHLLEDRAGETPDAIAITAPGRGALTYGRLYAHVQERVEAFNAMGIGRGDRVALVLPYGLELAAAFLSVAAATTCAPLNPAYRESEFDFYLADLDVSALLVQADQESPAIAVAHRRGIPVIRLSPFDDSGASVLTLDGPARRRAAQDGPAQREDLALLLHTSGTTSRPKIVPLTHANICASAFNIVAALGLDERDRCLSLMPLFHIHGLIGALLSSLAAGGSVVCAPYDNVSRFANWLEECRPTWYTTVPTLHEAIARVVRSERGCGLFRPLRFVRSSSAALPLPLRDELEEVLDVPVIQAYGMTEAAHQIASNPLPPGARKDGSVGVPTGTEVAIMDESGSLLEAGRRGEIVIRGANVTRGYERNAAANASAFIDGWFRTGDQGFLDQDGYLFITGRLKEMINRGGEKISPYEVEDVLMAHAAVRQAVTFSVPHPKLGEDVGAAIVLRENASTTERELREFARTRLAEFKVPRRVVVVSELPKGPTGKLQRLGLAERLGLTLSPDPASYVPPRETVEHQLVQIWEELLGVGPIGMRDNFFERGGHSLLAVEMLERVAQACGKRLPVQTLFSGATVEHLAKALLARQAAELDASPLVVVQQGGAKHPLFFLHGDRDGGGFYCLNLARGLGEDQPFYALAPHGHDGREVPATVEAMAADYLAIVQGFQPHGPYLLGGYCNGGVVAYEMARQLQLQGAEVKLLVLIAASGWNTQYRRLHRLISGIGALLGRGAEARARDFRVWRARLVRLRQLCREGIGEQLAFALDHAKRGYLRLTRAMGREEQAPHLSPRATGESGHNLEAIYSNVLGGYMPGPYGGRVTLIWPNGDGVKRSDDPTMGWGKIAGHVEIRRVPGDHASAITTHVKVLVEHLRECVSAAHAGSA